MSDLSYKPHLPDEYQTHYIIEHNIYGTHAPWNNNLDTLAKLYIGDNFM